MPSPIRALIAALLAASLAGCGGTYFADGEPVDPPQQDEGFQGNADRVGVVGDMFGGAQAGNVVIAGRNTDALAASVNRHLWRASIDTLSFMPIASTDPFTGVIATDWAATPESPDERFKVTAYVTDVALTPEALQVAVFREARADGGGWVTTQASPEVARRIEDAILTRARQLRIAEREAEG